MVSPSAGHGGPTEATMIRAQLGSRGKDAEIGVLAAVVTGIYGLEVPMGWDFPADMQVLPSSESYPVRAVWTTAPEADKAARDTDWELQKADMFRRRIARTV